ncbi:MAG: hypothetical protein CTY31_00955 [Hyphomicrobium sp.]|nr:MAG: hypothetical protein CTY39_05850 [Hyphomicrobium sp.]PPD01384.1 MAG: hypothetical protein CTY31_00955 [Hyphomicrobium sp.]
MYAGLYRLNSLRLVQTTAGETGRFGTLMADDNDSLLREVQEELRREQMQRIWERYNGIIIGAGALIVFAVGGYTYMKNSRIAEAEARGAEYASALQLSEAKNADAALASFEKIAASSSSGYSALAKLHLAGAQVKADKSADALKTYEALAADTSADPLLRDFAKLQAASLRLSDADFTEIQNRLTTLASDGSAYRTSANELLGLSAFKEQKYSEARKYLEPLLIDPKASAAIQDRIKIILAQIASAEVAQAQPASAEPSKSEPATSGALPTKEEPDKTTDQDKK